MKVKEKMEWLKEYKKEVLIGTITLIGGVALAAIGVKHMKTDKIFDKVFDTIEHRYAVDLEAVPIKELGNIGKNFLKNIPEATNDTLVQVVAYIEKKDLVS